MFEYFRQDNGRLMIELVDPVRDTIEVFKSKNGGSATPSVFVDTSEYLLGQGEPHYPVPALPMKLERYTNPVINGPTYCMLVQYEGMDNGRYYYGHEIIPLW